MYKKIVFCLLAIALVSTLAGPIAFADQKLAKKQVLYYASGGRDIRAMDPAFALSSIEIFITYSMFNALVRYPPGNEGNLEAIEPDLAEKWEVSKDGKNWTFYLRKGVKFHKGYGELTAEDVKFTFDRLKPEGSPWAKDYKNVKEVKIVDDYTVVFSLEMVDPFFLSKMTNYHGGFIVSKKAREKLGDLFKTEPVGTGPFQVGEYRPKDRYIVVRHEDYWRGKPILEKMIVPFMPAIASRTLSLEKGEVHCAIGKTDEKWVEKMRKAGLTVDVTFSMGIASWLHFNMTRKPFNDIRVRKALAYAIDREQFVQFFGPSLTEQLYSYVPPDAFGALSKADIPEDLRYEYNPEKAKKLLKEAGFPKGFKTKMFVSERGSYMNPMTLIQEQWRKVGVDLIFETIDHPTYHSKIRKDANDLVWYNATRTPIAGVYLEHWFHSNSIVGKKTAITNFSHYGDVDANEDGKVDSIDMFVDKAEIEMDPKEQKRLYAQAQLQLLKDLPAFPVRNYHFVFGRQKYIDLGYEPKQTMIYAYHITEKTKILAH
jgi:peptide/nickel transport system substrate-binding protein